MMWRAPGAALAFVLLAAPLGARDREFDRVVRAFEHQYGKRKLSIPLLGFANLFVKVARPAGARDFKLAIFEDVDSRRHPAPEDLDAMMRPAAAGGWAPFVRVNSRRSGERVQIYSRRKGTSDWELLIATLERSEAVVLRVELNPESLSRWVNNPAAMARRHDRAHN